METEKTEGVVDTTNNEGEGKETDNISILKKDYDVLNQTLGSLKKEIKDLRKANDKPKEETKETPKSNQTDDNVLLQKLERMSLRQAGITHEDDMELARKTAIKWKVDIDDVLLDDDFKIKLERQQTSRANVEATSGVKGGAGSSTQAKNTPEYWIAKGTPPSAADIPDNNLRRKIASQILKNAKRGSGKKFYND